MTEDRITNLELLVGVGNVWVLLPDVIYTLVVALRPVLVDSLPVLSSLLTSVKLRLDVV